MCAEVEEQPDAPAEVEAEDEAAGCRDGEEGECGKS